MYLIFNEVMRIWCREVGICWRTGASLRRILKKNHYRGKSDYVSYVVFR
jgi:hypothetical protein